jgi:hypothetical protein
VGRIIRAELHEAGQQAGLFGGELTWRQWTRRLSEAEGDDDGGETVAGLTRSAAGDPRDSEAYGDRETLMDEYDRALRAGDEQSADEFHRRLKAHHRVRGAARERKPLAAAESRASRTLHGRVTMEGQGVLWYRRLL